MKRSRTTGGLPRGFIVPEGYATGHTPSKGQAAGGIETRSRNGRRGGGESTAHHFERSGVWPTGRPAFPLYHHRQHTTTR
jgi:hypothetical protein